MRQRPGQLDQVREGEPVRLRREVAAQRAVTDDRDALGRRAGVAHQRDRVQQVREALLGDQPADGEHKPLCGVRPAAVEGGRVDAHHDLVDALLVWRAGDAAQRGDRVVRAARRERAARELLREVRGSLKDVEPVRRDAIRDAGDGGDPQGGQSRPRGEMDVDVHRRELLHPQCGGGEHPQGDDRLLTPPAPARSQIPSDGPRVAQRERDDGQRPPSAWSPAARRGRQAAPAAGVEGLRDRLDGHLHPGVAQSSHLAAHERLRQLGIAVAQHHDVRRSGGHRSRVRLRAEPATRPAAPTRSATTSALATASGSPPAPRT